MSKPKPTVQSIQKKTRLTLELSTLVSVRLNVLQMDTGAESATEVIRRALALYDTVVTAGRQGDEVRIVVRHKDGTEESMLIPRSLV